MAIGRLNQEGTCPFCGANLGSQTSVCSGCGRPLYAQPQTEWKALIDQIVKGYENNGKGLVHGLQKDAIQNSWGARLKRKPRHGEWGTSFELISAGETSYLCITDWGTYGLTGRVFDDPSEIPERLPPEERLARFESMFFSGGNYGPGLYGRGKLIFQASSRRREIYYDSLTCEHEYRLGRRFQEGRNLKQLRQAYQGEAAQATIVQWTRGVLRPLARPGTRISIVDPVPDVVDAITSGAFLRFIEETWWEILLKYGAEIMVSFDGVPQIATCPDLYRQLYAGELPAEQCYLAENLTVAVKGLPYRVKRIALAKADVPEDLRGLSVQRKGMKITTVDLKDVPSDLRDSFFGAIELDAGYEDLLEEAENLEHYGFDSKYASYRELKKLAQGHFDLFKEQLGYSAQRDNPDARAKEAMRQAHDSINKVMGSLGLTGLGVTSPRRREISVQVENVTFPAGSSEVVLGDVVSDIRFRLRNHTDTRRKVKAYFETYSADRALIEVVYRGSTQLEAGECKTIGPLEVILTPSHYPNHQVVKAVFRAEDALGNHLASTSFPLYVGITEPQNDEAVKLTLESIRLPRSRSPRVDYGEAIRDLRYLIKNLTHHTLAVRFLLRTHDKSHDNSIIETIRDDLLELRPLAEISVDHESIGVTERCYSQVDGKRILLRARVVSARNQAGYGKSYILAESNRVIWINRDPRGFGVFADMDTVQGGPDSARAYAKKKNGEWVFYLNTTHPHYEAVYEAQATYSDDSLAQYVFGLMAREALYVALHEEKYDVFENVIGPNDLPDDVAQAVNKRLDQILAAYYQQ